MGLAQSRPPSAFRLPLWVSSKPVPSGCRHPIVPAVPTLCWGAGVGGLRGTFRVGPRLDIALAVASASLDAKLRFPQAESPGEKGWRGISSQK